MSSQQLTTSSVDFDSTMQSQLKFKSKIENVTNGSNTNIMEHEQQQRNRSTNICPPGKSFSFTFISCAYNTRLHA